MHRHSSADPGRDLSFLPLGNPEFLPPDLNQVAQPFVGFSWERNGQINNVRPFPFCRQLSLPLQHLPVNSFFGVYGAGNSHPISSFAAGKPPETGLPEQYLVERVVGRLAGNWEHHAFFFITFMVAVVVIVIMGDQETADV